MIITIVGKSSAGKDTILKELLTDAEVASLAKPLVTYTTRPMRPGEKEGVEYHFVSQKEYQCLLHSGEITEHRSYDTAYGVWNYFTILPKDYKENHYILVASPEQVKHYISAIGKENILPVYIDVDNETRLRRMISRESKGNRKFDEVCRRFLADEMDFSESILESIGIKRSYENRTLSECVVQIKLDILEAINRTKQERTIPLSSLEELETER